MKHHTLVTSGCILVLLSSLTSVALLAKPANNNRTISWPASDWYATGESVELAADCKGQRSCEVSPGTYIVLTPARRAR